MVGLGVALAGPLLTIALQRFPAGELPATRGARLAPWLFAPIGRTGGSWKDPILEPLSGGGLVE